MRRALRAPSPLLAVLTSRTHPRPPLPRLQAQLLLPAGCGLAQLEAQLHHDSIQLHSYALAPPEERLASVLQQHLLGVSAAPAAQGWHARILELACLHSSCRAAPQVSSRSPSTRALQLWDVLHEFGLNHFGRLVQFAAAGTSAAAAAAAGGTPGTPVAAAAGGTPTAPRLGAPADSPVPDGSPATPVGPSSHGPISAAAAAAEQPDPMQHDWAQVELQVVHSIWHSNALPARGKQTREPDALALMMHVLDCVRALRWGLASWHD